MEPKDAIYTRRSVRSYVPDPLDDEDIDRIRGWIDGAKRLTDDAFEYDIVGPESIKTLMKWRAPHYICIYSRDDMMSGVNVGFVFQQVDLLMQANGIGSCWLGMAKPAKPQPHGGLGWGISMSFGRPTDYPEVDKGSNRKPLSEISDTEDPRLEPARVAPSAVNSQTWFFKRNQDAYDLYYKPKVLKVPGITYFNYNDLGICLAHLCVSYPESFSFDRDGRGDRKYVGTVRFRFGGLWGPRLPYLQRPLHREDEYPTVAGMTGVCGGQYRIDHLVRQGIVHHDLDLHLLYLIDGERSDPVGERYPHLLPAADHVRHGDAADRCLGECVLHALQPLWPDHSYYHLHAITSRMPALRARPRPVRPSPPTPGSWSPWRPWIPPILSHRRRRSRTPG